MDKVKKSLVLGTSNFSKNYRFFENEFLMSRFTESRLWAWNRLLRSFNAYEVTYHEIKLSGIGWHSNAKIVLSDNPRNYLKEVGQKVVVLVEVIPKVQINCLMMYNSSKQSKVELESVTDAMQIVGNRYRISNKGLSLYSDDENKIMINGSITIQIPVNILDQKICSSTTISDKLRNTPEAQARSIFLRGLLSSLDISHSVVYEKDLTDPRRCAVWSVKVVQD